MTITSILKQLEGLSREEMIARLEPTLAELQSERMKMIVVKKDHEIWEGDKESYKVDPIRVAARIPC